MPCRWVTIEGRRVRVGPVDRPVVARPEPVLSPRERLEKLGLFYAFGSPEISIEELRDAIIRVWHDPEKGYMVEARLSPRKPPIYHYVSADEARQLESGEYPPDLIARLFTPTEPGYE